MKQNNNTLASLCIDSLIYNDCYYADIGRKQQEKQKLMAQLKSLQGKMTPSFMDYCQEKGINLTDWYKWQLHIMWEIRNLQRKSEKINKLEKDSINV